jgi:FlaA1/EpsC-like NDP-sugar epimerase
MIRLADMVPDEDIKIEITGLRPGEKLYEELFDAAEERTETNIPSTFAAHPDPLSRDDIEHAIETLRHLAKQNDVNGIIQCIDRLVPGFTHESR